MNYIPVIKLRQEIIQETPIKFKKLNNITNVVGYAQELIGDYDRETFIVFGLNTQMDINFISTVSVGSLNSAIIHPLEIFKACIVCNCAHLIIAHNHPFGDVSPSTEDFSFTNRICGAGKLLGIKVIDLVIVSLTDYYSFLEKGHI